MSHTPVRGLQTELEHIEFARERFAAIAETIEKDLIGTITPQTKLALTALMEYAKSGANLAERSKEMIVNSNASNSSSH